MSLLPVADALARLLEGVHALGPEEVELFEAAGRVLAAPLPALRTHPPFAASAMDGYAVRAADLAAPPVLLGQIGEIAAGHAFGQSLGPGECARIFTGAPLPAGADAVLIQENAEPLDGGGVRALAAVSPGQNVRPAGQDFIAGEELLPAGRVLDAAGLALAAAANHPRLAVVRRPRVAILATGDELVPPGSDPGPGQIIASNAYGIAAMIREAGGEPLDLGIVADRRETIASRIREGFERGADILVTLGGASVGDHDLVGPVLADLGVDLVFRKVAMRPGKPLMAGRLGHRHVLGLPGNPASALVTAWVFLVPLIARLSGRQADERSRAARLGTAMEANGSRQDHVRARIVSTDEGLVAFPWPRQDSSMLQVLAASHGLILRPPDAPAAAPGDACRVLLLRPPARETDTVSM